MDEDATWYGGRPWPRDILLDGDRAAATERGIVSYRILRVWGSSLLWTHMLRPFYSRLIALTQEGRSLVNDVCECVRD